MPRASLSGHGTLSGQFHTTSAAPRPRFPAETKSTGAKPRSSVPRLHRQQAESFLDAIRVPAAKTSARINDTFDELAADSERRNNTPRLPTLIDVARRFKTAPAQLDAFHTNVV